MAGDNLTSSQGLLKECLDEIDGLVVKLTEFPPTVLAMALRLHLEALLMLLIQHRICTRVEVRQFLHEMEGIVLPDLQ